MAVSLALAHENRVLPENPWLAWNLTPDIVFLTGVVAALYVAGWRRRNGRASAVPAWRHVSFFGGLGLIFLSLQSPLDTLSEHNFFLHQVQHLLLHGAGPLFLMLAAPQIMLGAGLPRWARRWLLQPLSSNGALRAVFSVLAHPSVATLLFVGSIYFWQIPRYHELAVLNDGVHYLMHVTLLVTGLIFFWRVFDPRPAPLGAAHGRRVVMLWVAAVANILIGAVLTLKTTVLYPAYDTLGRMFLDAMPDERYGALTLWIPGGMMYLFAALFLIRIWADSDDRQESRQRRGLSAGPTPADQRRANRTLALRVALIGVAVFVAILGIGVIRSVFL